MDKNNFSKLTLEEKIERVLDHNKKKLITGGSIDRFIYLVDTKNSLHVVPVENKKFLENVEYRELFRSILKGVINDFASEKIRISHLFYIKDSFFNPHYKDVQNINLDESFDKHNANECLMVYSEDKMNMTLTVFDKITGVDNGNKYTVLSGKPIKR